MIDNTKEIRDASFIAPFLAAEVDRLNAQNAKLRHEAMTMSLEKDSLEQEIRRLKAQIKLLPTVEELFEVANENDRYTRWKQAEAIRDRK